MSPIRKIEGKESRMFSSKGYIQIGPDIHYHHEGRFLMAQIPVLEFNSKYGMNLDQADYRFITGKHGGEMICLKGGRMTVERPNGSKFILEAADTSGRFIPKDETVFGAIKRRFSKVDKRL